MSKYPGNPFWCQDHDTPFVMTREEWAEAKAEGQLTPEHCLVRLANIATRFWGTQGSVGFDEDGFMISLTAASMTVEGGVKLIVNSRDHPPPHVHIKLRSRPRANLRIRLDDGERLGPLPQGITEKQFRSLQNVVVENSPQLAAWWESYHGDRVLALGH